LAPVKEIFFISDRRHKDWCISAGRLSRALPAQGSKSDRRHTMPLPGQAAPFNGCKGVRGLSRRTKTGPDLVGPPKGPPNGRAPKGPVQEGPSPRALGRA
jgi:hypothetical protein